MKLLQGFGLVLLLSACSCTNEATAPANTNATGSEETTEHNLDSLNHGTTDALSANGVVAFGAECWIIQSDGGEVYTPSDLPTEFEHEGLRVAITYWLRPNLASYCMQGETIELISIRAEQ